MSRISFLIINILFIGILQASAQEVSLHHQISEQKKQTEPTNCEYNTHILTASSQDVGEQGLIIAISRLGKGESRKLHHRRLHNVRTFLTEFGKRNPKTIILAEGENVEGLGRIEVYIRGVLIESLTFAKNNNLSVGICVYEEGEGPCDDERQMKLYPCLDKSLKANKNKPTIRKRSK